MWNMEEKIRGSGKSRNFFEKKFVVQGSLLLMLLSLPPPPKCYLKSPEIYIGERMPGGPGEGGRVGWRVGFETFRTAKGSTKDGDDDDAVLEIALSVRVELWDERG